MALTKTSIAQIRAELEAATKAIYAKHGVDVVVGRISWNDESFRCKVEGNVRTGATVATPKAVALKGFSFILGDKFDESKTYVSPSLGHVKVTGYNAKAIKYPFIVKRLSTGQSYKLTAMQAKSIVDNGAVA